MIRERGGRRGEGGGGGKGRRGKKRGKGKGGEVESVGGDRVGGRGKGRGNLRRAPQQRCPELRNNVPDVGGKTKNPKLAKKKR